MGSTRLDRQRENRLLIGAIGVVSSEVEENRKRIDRLRAQGLSEHDTGKRLTLGDWSSNKSALAGLLLRNKPLWDEVVGVYGVIYEARSSPGEPADVDRLAELNRRLDDLKDPLVTEQVALKGEIRVFSAPFGRTGERS